MRLFWFVDTRISKRGETPLHCWGRLAAANGWLTHSHTTSGNRAPDSGIFRRNSFATTVNSACSRQLSGCHCGYWSGGLLRFARCSIMGYIPTFRRNLLPSSWKRSLFSTLLTLTDDDAIDSVLNSGTGTYTLQQSTCDIPPELASTMLCETKDLVLTRLTDNTRIYVRISVFCDTTNRISYTRVVTTHTAQAAALFNTVSSFPRPFVHIYWEQCTPRDRSIAFMSSLSLVLLL